VDDNEIRYLTLRLAPGLAGYVVLIVIGWFLPLVAVFGYLVLAVFLLIPLRRRRRGLVGLAVQIRLHMSPGEE